MQPQGGTILLELKEMINLMLKDKHVCIDGKMTRHVEAMVEHQV